VLVGVFPRGEGLAPDRCSEFALLSSVDSTFVLLRARRVAEKEMRHCRRRVLDLLGGKDCSILDRH
jgi:hypothetical protein